MIRLLLFIDGLLGLYTWILIATAILSWLIAFNVVNVRNGFARMVFTTLAALTEPVLRPFRRVIPNAGGLDLSFIVVFLLIMLLRQVLIPDLIDALAARGG
jgi:YggT family protein